MTVGLNEPKSASAEGGTGLENVLLVFFTEQAGLDQRLGEVGKRIVAGAHDGQFPGDGGAGHGAAMEFQQQSGTDEGGFAATGGTDHGEEAGVAQALQQLGDLFFAPKKQVVFVKLKRTQAGEWIAFKHGTEILFFDFFDELAKRTEVVVGHLNDLGQVRSESILVPALGRRHKDGGGGNGRGSPLP